MTCDHSNCNQGRDCPDAHMATRRVFWLEPSEPVGYEAAWKPEPEAADPMEPTMRRFSGFLLAVAGAFVAVAILIFTN